MVSPVWDGEFHPCSNQAIVKGPPYHVGLRSGITHAYVGKVLKLPLDTKVALSPITISWYSLVDFLDACTMSSHFSLMNGTRKPNFLLL